MNFTLSGSPLIMATLFFYVSCADVSPNQEMIDLLSSVAKSEYTVNNAFCPEAKMDYLDSALKQASGNFDIINLEYVVSQTLLELGNEQKSLEISEDLIRRIPFRDISHRQMALKNLAIAYLRLGERTNCINDHSGESCIFPISGRGVHEDRTGSQKAIEIYERILSIDPNDLESRWLLNIAYMTIDGYPEKVPAAFLIKGLNENEDSSTLVKPFIDEGVNTGLNKKNMAGGSIIDDFNNDGYLDLVTSSMGMKEGLHYCINNSDGSFTDASDSSGLKYLTGGLNIMQTDYNNDGLKDIFVLRGAWKGEYGKEPNSLLKNNGDGTFTDVTRQSGLLSFHPTQTATWADFDNDGWLDVFIGNETKNGDPLHPCELYMNNHNGTFSEVAARAGCAFSNFVKGVTSGDYDKDGLTDIFISTLRGDKILLKNEGVKNNVVQFKDVSRQAGVDVNRTRSFSTWFWDYDNDGWLDIAVCGYEFDRSLAWYTAAEALNMPVGPSGKVFLFRNRHDGTFEDVSQKVGLNKIAFAMGANFGDIDNDGYLDMYLGTGNPSYQSLVPNKMFKSINGSAFADVTTAARVGNLQKGHGVAFADLDNDGDQDIYLDMGGAYVGDAYQNSLYINPGQNDNRWINISLEGVASNRVAIGAKIKVTFEENGMVRSVYRDVNSGGSFGSNPLLQHIGVGQAKSIQSVEITWPASRTTQLFKNLTVNENIAIKEGSDAIVKSVRKKVDFSQTEGIIRCTPL